MSILARTFDERFAVLQMGPDTVGGVVFSLDRDKRLTIARTIPEAPFGAHPRLAGGLRPVTLIVACDSSVAYTALIPVHFIRERIREPLRQVELENFLARAVSKVINQCRAEAMQAIGAKEVDLILAKSRVMNFTIDNHQVLNPLGFRAQKIEALVELTFTTRTIFEEARRLAGHTRSFFTETAHAELAVLARAVDAPIELLSLRLSHSGVFVREPAPIGYAVKRSELRWTTGCFGNAVREVWGVSQPLARRIYEDHLAGRHSPHAARFMGKLVAVCVRLFSRDVKASGLKGKAYVDTALPLPFPLPYKKRRVTLVEPPVEKLLERFGFTFHEGDDALAPSLRFRMLAPFFEHFYDRGQGTLNEWLRRHLHWLGSPMHEDPSHPLAG